MMIVNSSRIKNEISPATNCNMKVEQLEFREALRDLECDILIKQEDLDKKVDSYDANTTVVQNLVEGSNRNGLKLENTPTSASNTTEELYSNTANPVPPFFCQHCNMNLETSILYKHYTHQIYSDDPNSYCQTCDIKLTSYFTHWNHLREVHKLKLSLSWQKRNRNIEPDPNDPDFYCRSCTRSFFTVGRFRSHLRNTHKMNLQPFISKKPNPKYSIVPDPNDPNFYCKSCSRKYPSVGIFRAHLRDIHKMDLPPFIRLCPKPQSKPEHDIAPDPDDPNFYCRSCDSSFLTIGRFRAHLRFVHKMNLQPYIRIPKSKKNGIAPDPNDSNLYCRSCIKSYLDVYKFRSHLRVIHKMKLHPIIKTNSKHDITPDPNDPNFYCRSCTKNYLNAYRFRSHLRVVHKMNLDPIIKTNSKHDITPDPNDPNFYCRSCTKNYLNACKFRSHLRSVHQINLHLTKKKPRPSKPKHAIVPDADDPNFYCKSCIKNYPTIARFRAHLRVVHKMILQPFVRKPKSKPEHAIAPDADDPNFYCKSCIKNYPTIARFRAHLRTVHKMTLQPVIRNQSRKRKHATSLDPSGSKF